MSLTSTLYQLFISFIPPYASFSLNSFSACRFVLSCITFDTVYYSWGIYFGYNINSAVSLVLYFVVIFSQRYIFFMGNKYLYYYTTAFAVISYISYEITILELISFMCLLILGLFWLFLDLFWFFYLNILLVTLKTYNFWSVLVICSVALISL